MPSGTTPQRTTVRPVDIVDLVTDPDVLSIPSKISAETVTGFTLRADRIVPDCGREQRRTVANGHEKWRSSVNGGEQW
ncbi:hypothetical protein DDQ41_26535 [Streptomyces spongiicola]|uniref:FXSXX-COOH protein n=1 Tax=Streptomyces spongiicola TaxID=1690221 RepID=A0ABM6VDB2_9ACTN|nr:hypothetical protein DDQ41_26535 [Streptomyces spongiicola]